MNRLVLVALYPVRLYAYATTLPEGRPAAVQLLAEEPKAPALPASG